MIIALLWSWRAPATISDAEADPWLIITIIGLSLAISPPDADPGTIRADLATKLEENVVHGSDSPELKKN